MKKVLIVVGILVAAAAIVALGMFLRGGIGGSPEGPTGSLPPGNTLPIAGTNGTGTPGENNEAGGAAPGEPDGDSLPIAGVSTVAQAAVLDYSVGPNGVTFVATNGAVISTSTTEAVAQANFGNLLGAWFSPDGKWLLVRSGSHDLSRWSLLDVAKKTWRDIQVNTAEMIWSQNGSQLAYFARRTGGTTLSTYTPATNSIRALLTLSSPDLTLRWKDASHILIMDRPSSIVPSTIWDFSMTGTLTQFAINVSGADILWGGPRSGGLFFRAGPTGGTLAVVNSGGATIQSASFLTFPSKCVFGERAVTSTVPNISDLLLCAIPQDQAMMKERQLPDSYLKGEFGTIDTIYAIGIFDGSFTPVLPASQSFSFDAANLRVYGDSLYFVNRNDKKLYRVSLSALTDAAPEE